MPRRHSGCDIDLCDDDNHATLFDRLAAWPYFIPRVGAKPLAKIENSLIGAVTKATDRGVPASMD
jgi:hypothetical protein